MNVRNSFLVILTLCGTGFLYAQETLELAFPAKIKDSFLRIIAIDSKNEELFLWDDDPLSSVWMLDIDGTSVTPSEDGWIRESQEMMDSRTIRYFNRNFEFEQLVTISPDRFHAQLTIYFKNNSKRSVFVGPSLLLDTSLGEKTGIPFSISQGIGIQVESIFEGNSMPKWVKTAERSLRPSFIIDFENQNSSQPESLVMANWLRLKEGGPRYTPVVGRNFDYLPFFKGDSALLINFDTKKVSPEESIDVTLVFSLADNVPTPIDSQQEQTIVAVDDVVNDADAFVVADHGVDEILDNGDVDIDIKNALLKEYTIRERLRELNAAIYAINILLAGEETISRNTIIELEKRIKVLEKYRSEYENL